MKYTNLKNERTLTMAIVKQTLTKKVKDLESALDELNRSIKQGDGSADGLIDEVRYSFFEIACITDLIADSEKKIFNCANTILSYMQKDTCYDTKGLILMMEDEGNFIGDVNRAMRVLETAGIIARRIINETEAVYLADSLHKLIVAEVNR